ncbi:hypothetical protein B5S31_g2389 [[Candida] boidinii]|nr:hypothetical protein B5S31_g2389 [[Candida] boidinii]OWB79254.1 hypothetical protein B5S32_g3469 [[Candida] boidinii]
MTLIEGTNYWACPKNTEDIKVFITTEKLNYDDFTGFVKSPKAGAIVVFGGTTRDNFEDKTVVTLEYESYTKLALNTIFKIAQEQFELNSKKEGNDKIVHKVCIAHKLGSVPILEESIIIAVSTSHRKEGFQVCENILELIKEKAEIWKKEKYNDGSDTWKENENSNVKK